LRAHWTHLITERRKVPGLLLPTSSLQVVGLSVMLTFIRILMPLLWEKHHGKQSTKTQVRRFDGIPEPGAAALIHKLPVGRG
jgi:hypothetical protein